MTAAETTDAAADALKRAFVAQLSAERAAAGFSVMDLVQRSGIPERTLTRYLTGERNIPVSAQLKICSALGVPLSTVWKRAEDRWREGQPKDDSPAS